MRPSANWTSGTISSADLAAIPQARATIYGNGIFTTPPVGHFRRENNTWFTASDNMIGVVMYHNSRAGMAYVELQLGVDGTSMRSYFMSRVNGRYAYWFNLGNNTQTNTAGEILAIARGVPVNGTERVVSMRVTLDTNNTLSNAIVPIYVGNFGSGTTPLDFTATPAPATKTNPGLSKATAVATFYEGVFLAARINALGGYSTQVRYKAGATYPEVYNAAFGPEQLVARLVAQSAALCNTRRIDVLSDTAGGTCTIARSDRVFSQYRGLTFNSTLTAGVTNITLSGPFLATNAHGVSSGYGNVGAYAIRHPTTGEVRFITLSNDSSGAVTIDRGFSNDIPAGAPVWISSNDLILPANNLHLDGVTVDQSTIVTLSALSCQVSAGVMWPQLYETNFGRVDPNGWTGPVGFTDQPATSSPYGYFQASGATSLGAISETNVSQLFGLSAQVASSPASLSVLGFDGQRGTFGSIFAGGYNGNVQNIQASGLIYSENVSGMTCQDANYHNCDNVRQFKHRIGQKAYSYYRQHYAKYLTVAKVMPNTAIVSGAEYGKTGFTTLVMAEDPTAAGVNGYGFTYSASTTVSGYNDIVRFLTGSLFTPWSTTNLGTTFPYCGSGTYTPSGGSLVCYLTVSDSTGLITSSQIGSTCIGFAIQHPDGQQWGSPVAKLGAISNTLLQGGLVFGDQVQNIYNDAGDGDASQVLAQPTQTGHVCTITISGLNGTFPDLVPQMNVGDFVVIGSNVGFVATVNADKSVVFDSSSTLTNVTGSAFTWEADIKTAGTSVTFSSPVVFTTDEFFGINSGTHIGAYSRLSGVTQTPLLNASSAVGATNSSGTMPKQLVSPVTLVGVDISTWTRWKKGKAANHVAIVNCIFNSKNYGGGIRSAAYNWMMLQCAFAVTPSGATAKGLTFSNFLVGSGIESFVIRDSVLFGLGGYDSTFATTYFGNSTPAVYLPYQGLVLDNNRYQDRNSYISAVAASNIDPTGVTTASGSVPLTPTTITTQAVFNDTTLRPVSGVALSMKGGPSGLPLVPFDFNEVPLVGLAANNLVGALQAS